MGYQVTSSDEKFNISHTNQYYNITEVDEINIPFTSDLLMRLNTRSTETFTDAINNNDATILTPEFININGGKKLYGDKTRSTEKILDGNNHTLYMRINHLTLSDSTRKMFYTGSSGRHLYITNFFKKTRVRCSDGTNTETIDVITDAAAQVDGLDYYDFLVTIDGSAKQIDIYAYNPSEGLINSETLDISAFTLNNDVNADNFTFGDSRNQSLVTNFKKYSEIKTLAQCLDHGYTTDLDVHLPNLLTNVDISGNSNHYLFNTNPVTADVIYDKFNQLPLDYGIDRYEDSADTYYNKYIVYGSSGRVSIDESATVPAIDYPLASYRTTAQRGKDSDGVNHPDVKIRFTHSFFDRSNVTIWSANARSGYYDAVNTKDFHISELNQRTLTTWLNIGYKGRLFVKFTDNSIEKWDRKLLEEVILYGTDKTGIDHVSVLEYTDDIFAAIMDESSYDYDANNYIQLGILKTTKPMLVFRIDDGDQSAYDDWWPFIQGYNWSAIMGIHSAEVGTSGTYNYMDWDDIADLVADGWIIADHNKYDVDFDTLAYIELTYPYMISAKSTIGEHSITIKNYIGNRHSSHGKHIDYFAHKNGYKSHIAWNDYSSVNGTNPQAVDMFRMCAMACDLMGPYYLLDADNSQEIQALKDQMDLCVSNNRLAIIFFHVHTSAKQTAIEEVIDYAVAAGVNLVTMDDVINDLKYQ